MMQITFRSADHRPWHCLRIWWTLQDVASSYAQQWRTLAFSNDQSYITAQFGQDTTFGLIYNLYAHRLLQMDLLPDTVSEIFVFNGIVRSMCTVFRTLSPRRNSTCPNWVSRWYVKVDETVKSYVTNITALDSTEFGFQLDNSNSSLTRSGKPLSRCTCNSL